MTTSYQAFDTEAVKALVIAVPALAAAVGPGELVVSEIGDGNLNQVFVVKAASGAAVIVKQALPYLRVAGEGWPLTRERMRFETASLLLYNDIAPDLAPRVLAHDADQSWVAMEFLHEHTVLRTRIIGSELPDDVGGDLGRFVARLFFRTSALSLDGPSAKQYETQYSNPALCELQEQFVFTHPFFDSQENVWNPAINDLVTDLRSDRSIKLAVTQAKHRYMTVRQGLLHGDLHTGSVMVSRGNGPARTKLIDPEFAFVGPVGYDLGTLFAHFAINAAARTATGRPAGDVIAAIRSSWNAFVSELEQLWTLTSTGDVATRSLWASDPDGFDEFRRNVIDGIAVDCARQGGCELLRRCMGIVSVADIEEITDPAAREHAERLIVAIARHWLLTPLDAFGANTTIDTLVASVEDSIDSTTTGTEQGNQA